MGRMMPVPPGAYDGAEADSNSDLKSVGEAFGPVPVVWHIDSRQGLRDILHKVAPDSSRATRPLSGQEGDTLVMSVTIVKKAD
jgi:hypothetical protein